MNTINITTFFFTLALISYKFMILSQKIVRDHKSRDLVYIHTRHGEPVIPSDFWHFCF